MAQIESSNDNSSETNSVNNTTTQNTSLSQATQNNNNSSNSLSQTRQQSVLVSHQILQPTNNSNVQVTAPASANNHNQLTNLNEPQMHSTSRFLDDHENDPNHTDIEQENDIENEPDSQDMSEESTFKIVGVRPYENRNHENSVNGNIPTSGSSLDLKNIGIAVSRNESDVTINSITSMQNSNTLTNLNANHNGHRPGINNTNNHHTHMHHSNNHHTNNNNTQIKKMHEIQTNANSEGGENSLNTNSGSSLSNSINGINTSNKSSESQVAGVNLSRQPSTINNLPSFQKDIQPPIRRLSDINSPTLSSHDLEQVSTGLSHKIQLFYYIVFYLLRQINVGNMKLNILYKEQCVKKY